MNLNKIYSENIKNKSKEDIKKIEDLLKKKEDNESSEIINDLNELITQLNPIEIIDIILFIDFDLLKDFIELAKNKLDHHMIPNIDNERAMIIFETIGVENFANLVNRFEDYEFHEFLQHHVDIEDYEDLEDHLDQKKQSILEEFLSYPENSAGRLMEKNIVYSSAEWNIRQIRDYLRYSPNISNNIERIFLIDKDKKIVGNISLAKILKTSPDIIAKDIMNMRFTVVKYNDSQKKVTQLFQRYSLSFILVSDAEDGILGVITTDNVIDALEMQVDQNFMRSQYLTNSEHIQNKNFLSSISIRIPWLFINIIFSMLVSGFIAHFTTLFEKHIELMVIIPIIASISSISGAQTIATTIHTLAKNDVDKSNILRIFSHEIIVSISIAFIIAALSGIIVYFRFGKPIAILYFWSMFLDFIIASLSGIFIPLLTHFVFKWDPAIISPILVTTISDFSAYAFAITIAIYFLG